MKFKSIITTIALALSFNIYAQNGLDFDGTNDKIEVGNPSNLSLSGTAFTVEAWVYPKAWANLVWQGNVVNQENNSTNEGFMFRVGEGGKVNFGYGPPGLGPWVELTTAANTLQLNTWAHIAATYDGSYIRIYKDGLAVDSMASSSTMAAGNVPMMIGARNNDRFYQGLIDEVRIWSVTRTKQQINETMNTELCQASTGLELQYSLNQGTAGGNNAGVTSVTDASPNANNGTLSGFALSGASSNWVMGQTLGTSGTTMLTDTICQDEIYVFGNDTLTQAGMYSDTITGSSGCISYVNLDLHLINLNLNTFYRGDTFFLANAPAGATFQWISCTSGGAIFGETDTFYSPLDNGRYACRIKTAQCEVTTGCMSKLYTSIEEDASLAIQLYPNPATNQVTLQSPIPITSVAILDLTGKQLKHLELNSSKTTFSVADLPKGVYYLSLSFAKGERYIRKLVVE